LFAGGGGGAYDTSDTILLIKGGCGSGADTAGNALRRVYRKTTVEESPNTGGVTFNGLGMNGYNPSYGDGRSGGGGYKGGGQCDRDGYISSGGGGSGFTNTAKGYKQLEAKNGDERMPNPNSSTDMTGNSGYGHIRVTVIP
jgi:hypothetical protein